MSNLRLAIGIPAYGGMVSSYHARMWFEAGNSAGSSTDRFTIVAFGTWDVNPVDRARNFMLADAMRRNADWLLMIDADTFVEFDEKDDNDAGFQLLRMISDADRLGAGIVVAPVVSRNDQHLMVYRLNEESDRPSKLDPCDLTGERRGLVRIDSAATAVMGINMKAAHEAAAIFRFTETREVEGGLIAGLSEDHEFCRQIRNAGHKIYADTRVKTGHIAKALPLYNTAKATN